MLEQKGNLFILSGPSGVGKGTVLDALLKDYNDICYSISTTTREPRKGEVDGEDYFFASEDEFKSLVKKDEFLEWAKVHNNYYGTPKKYVDKTLEAGQDVILEIDIQGAKQVRDKFDGGIFIFLAPPSLKELESRINKRGTETKDAIATRLENANKELEEKKNYDYLVVNDQVEDAIKKIEAIIIAERCRL
ncbi:guanylate kinase [Halobacteroides halobius DSM 5150]|uniref:Guanylate kinase n=1 Tax=Halobacteroides halobius (strain ATCC 35273 / DSM 5150 / MD-1) TaxID=748449 RepID=L0K8G8_HALHC|nr:guanylate kinase [Halobacteroides halobius]AGB40825.1 guanylate kinase [Halobacteroides halobius DSM 5150]